MDLDTGYFVSSVSGADSLFCNRQRGAVAMDVLTPVSYTHLDVYKRQLLMKAKVSACCQTDTIPLLAAEAWICASCSHFKIGVVLRVSQQ